MRTAPYPIPPSRTWTATALGTYGVLAIAGALVLYVVATSPQPIEGWIVLGLWGGTTLPGALACVYGVLRDRYRYEWMGAWGIVLGTTVYLSVTTVGVVQAGPETLLASAPTLLFFIYGLGQTLGRAIVLSLIDLSARRRVQARTGEIPEVPVDEY